jgi:hypothetical protein
MTNYRVFIARITTEETMVMSTPTTQKWRRPWRLEG